MNVQWLIGRLEGLAGTTRLTTEAEFRKEIKEIAQQLRDSEGATEPEDEEEPLPECYSCALSDAKEFLETALGAIQHAEDLLAQGTEQS